MADLDTSTQEQFQSLQQDLQQKLVNDTFSQTELNKLFDTYKKQGDNAFKNVQFEHAIHYYTLALICHDDTVTYANRSLAHFKLENYAEALADGERSVQLDRHYIKGFYRIGVCQMALQNYSFAIVAFSQLLDLQPNETGARQQLANARKAYREQQYALAIGGEETSLNAVNGGQRYKAVFDRLNWDLPIPASYDGPELDTSINYMQESIYRNCSDVRHTEDAQNNISLYSKKYTLEFIEYIIYNKFPLEQAQFLPRVYIYHILRDFTELMRSLPTVVDYDVPTYDPLDAIDSEDTDEADQTNQDDDESTDMEDGPSTADQLKEKLSKQTEQTEHNGNKMSDSPQAHNSNDEATMGDDDNEDANLIKNEQSEKKQTSSENSGNAPVSTKKAVKKVPKTIQPGSLIVCGDTHGQFWDLLNIFKLYGKPSITNPFLFNGDFVDRGSFGFELVLTLMLYKLHCPLSMHLTRGNHETINMNRSFGFYGEVLHKADLSTFDCFTQAFNALPLAYVLGKKVLILHGGLFTDDGATLQDLRTVDRYRQPPEHGGLMVDCLWSDPHAFIKGRRPSVRGAGCQFGSDITTNWLKNNGLELLVRSHEMKHAGYEVTHGGKLVTIFSAPNYVDTMGNKGAVMVFDSSYTYQFHQFEAVLHPPVRAMHFADPYLR